MRGAGIAFGARGQNHERGIISTVAGLRRGRQTGRGQNVFQFAGTNHCVDFGNVFANLVAETLDQTSGNDQLFRLAAGFVGSHFEDRVDGFLLRAFDERAGIDHDDVGVFGAAGQFGSGPRQQAHHDFTIDKVLGTAETDEAYFLRTCRLHGVDVRILTRFLSLTIWLKIGRTADSEVFYGHAIFLF